MREIATLFILWLCRYIVHFKALYSFQRLDAVDIYFPIIIIVIIIILVAILFLVLLPKSGCIIQKKAVVS